MIRQFLSSILCCASANAYTPSTESTVFTPNWAVASLLTELGKPPLAMGDKNTYPLWVQQPVQPDSVIDVGSRYQPNRELLHQLPIRLIFDNFFYAHLHHLYPKEAQHIDIIFDGGNTEDKQSWVSYREATQKIAQALQISKEAEEYLRKVETDLHAYGQAIAQKTPHRFAVIQFVDARQIRLFASNSLFQVALDLMGLEHANLGKGNQWGIHSLKTYQLEQLPDDTCLIVIGPFSSLVQAELKKSYIWQRLGFGTTRCMKTLPAIWLSGGPDSIHHFAQSLHKAITQ